MDQFHYAVRGERRGPVAQKQLREMLARGELAPDSLIWQVGDSNWVKLAEHAAFADAIATPPPLPAVTRSAGVIRKTGRRLADLLPSIWLGALVALTGLGTTMFVADKSRVSDALLAIVLGLGFVVGAVICALIFFPRKDLDVPEPGPYRRAAARFIDCALTAVLVYGGAIWAVQRVLNGDLDHRAELFRVCTLVIIAMVWLGVHQALFEAVCQGVFGNTPGRALGGYQIRGGDGRPVSALTVALRSLKVWFVGMCAVLPPFTSFFMAYWYRRYREGKSLPWDNLQSGQAVSTAFGIGRVIAVVIAVPVVGMAALALGKVFSEFAGEAAMLPEPSKVASAKVLRPASDGDKWGWINEQGEFVIPPRFERVSFFRDGLAWAKSGDFWRRVDMRGRPVSENSFDEIREFSEGLWAVKKDGDWGFVDQRGEIVIPLEFKGVGPFSEGLAAAVTRIENVGKEGKRGKLGFIDRTGSFVIEPRFDPDSWDGRFTSFKNGIAIVRIRIEQEFRSGKVFEVTRLRTLRKDGSFAFDLDRLVREAFGDGYRVFILDRMNRGSDGSIVLKASAITDAKFDLNTGVLFVSAEGVPLFPPVKGISGAESFEEGYAKIEMIPAQGMRVPVGEELPRRVGFLDRTGKIAIPMQYEDGSDFSEGLAAVKIGGKWGFIEPSGRFVIEPRFALGGFFRDGFAFVELVGNKEAIIDRKGDAIRSWPKGKD